MQIKNAKHKHTNSQIANAESIPHNVKGNTKNEKRKTKNANFFSQKTIPFKQFGIGKVPTTIVKITISTQ